MANHDPLVKGRYTEPRVRLTDPAFKYVPAKQTNLAATFERIRAEQARPQTVVQLRRAGK